MVWDPDFGLFLHNINFDADFDKLGRLPTFDGSGQFELSMVKVVLVGFSQ